MVPSLNTLNKQADLYQQCRFQLIHALMDWQFESLQTDLAEIGIQLNMVSNDEHIPKIEQQIHTLKEHTQCIYCTLPFQKMPQ